MILQKSLTLQVKLMGSLKVVATYSACKSCSENRL